MSETLKIDDVHLATASQGGDREAFRLLMQRHNQQLFRVARSIVRDESEAEDVLQESYLRAYSALATFRGESTLLTWLTRIVINEARGRLRRRRLSTTLDEIDTAQASGALVVAFPGGQAVANPEAEAARVEIRSLIERAVDTLPEAFRLVFILRDVQECSVEETAELLGLRPQTVKTRLHRARRQLREKLHETLASAMRDTFPFLGKRCEQIIARVLSRLP